MGAEKNFVTLWDLCCQVMSLYLSQCWPRSLGNNELISCKKIYEVTWNENNNITTLMMTMIYWIHHHHNHHHHGAHHHHHHHHHHGAVNSNICDNRAYHQGGHYWNYDHTALFFKVKSCQLNWTPIDNFTVFKWDAEIFPQDIRHQNSALNSDHQVTWPIIW